MNISNNSNAIFKNLVLQAHEDNTYLVSAKKTKIIYHAFVPLSFFPPTPPPSINGNVSGNIFF